MLHCRNSLTLREAADISVIMLPIYELVSISHDWAVGYCLGLTLEDKAQSQYGLSFALTDNAINSANRNLPMNPP